MKGKRFTTLIAIFVISLLTCAATVGFTSASADENDFGDYFTFSNVTASVEEGNVVFNVTANNATVTSKYDFYLPETVVSFEDSSSYTVTVNTTDATEAGKLVIKFTLAEGVTSATAVVTSIKTAGKDLYSIDGEGKFTPVLENTFVKDQMKLTEVSALVWGYNYGDVSFEAYHGFYKTLNKEFVVVYGSNEAECDSRFTEYFNESVTEKPEEVTSYDVTSGVSVKFVTYDGNPSYDSNCVKVYWGLSDVEDKTSYVSKKLSIQKELPDDTAPAYVESAKLISDFFGGSASAEDTEYAEYLKEINEATKTDGDWKYIGSSTYFNVPTAIYDYIVSDYFASEDLTYVIYYKLPESDSFTKLSSTSTTKRFSLSKIGDYEYYVLATDPQNNSLELDEEWELKVDATTGIKGYYDEAGMLMVPVFSFYMGNRGPQVTAGSSYQDPGYVGSSYTDVTSFTVRGNDVSTEYILLYNSNDSLNEYDDASGWKAISTAEEFKEVFGSDEDFETLAWDDSALTFTPTAMGSYVVRCIASDSMAKSVSAETKVINVRSAMNKVDINTVYVWFENNWLSVLFLGIAALSLIGMIAVLVFVKPKDEVEVDVEDNN